MADVEMKEATAGASSKAKGSSKAAEGASEGKKRFEVKKVRLQNLQLFLGPLD